MTLPQDYAERVWFQFDVDRLKADLQNLTPEDGVPHFNQPYDQGEWIGATLLS